MSAKQPSLKKRGGFGAHEAVQPPRILRCQGGLCDRDDEEIGSCQFSEQAGETAIEVRLPNTSRLEFLENA